jgi:hypothetical protein
MPALDPDDRSLELALAVVGYQWAMRGAETSIGDPISGLERLAQDAAAFPQGQRPLAELYPLVARLTALSLQVLAALGDPDEVDGLQGFEGFALWRESR